MMVVVVTFQDSRIEHLRFDGPTNWDVRDGQSTAWNESGDVVAERENVYSAVYDRSLA